MIETFQVKRVILFKNPAISLKMFVCLQGQKMDVWQDDLESTQICARCVWTLGKSGKSSKGSEGVRGDPAKAPG